MGEYRREKTEKIRQRSRKRRTRMREHARMLVVNE